MPAQTILVKAKEAKQSTDLCVVAMLPNPYASAWT